MTVPNTLSATETAKGIDAGTLTCEGVIQAHLDRIDRRDADVLAWSRLAREAALERHADDTLSFRRRLAGGPPRLRTQAQDQR